MKFCNKCVGEDGACCDFCKHYDFNGITLKNGVRLSGMGHKDRIYTGDGHCRKHNRQEDPGDVCDDFHCEKRKEEGK